MKSVQETNHQEIQKQFEDLFRDLIADSVESEDWQQADIVFREGKVTDDFHDVEFLMASHQNGSSLLYSSPQNGSSLYSVISGESRVSFSIRKP